MPPEQRPGGGALGHHGRMTQTPPAPRVRLAAIDVCSPEAARILDRVLPAAGIPVRRGATFNSAL